MAQAVLIGAGLAAAGGVVLVLGVLIRKTGLNATLGGAHTFSRYDRDGSYYTYLKRGRRYMSNNRWSVEIL